MKFEEYLSEVAPQTQAHHEEMAHHLKREAAKHKVGSPDYHTNMGAHHWHMGQALHKAGKTAEARDHFHKSYGHTNN